MMRGGLVLDGSGRSPIAADVEVRDGVIVQVGALSNALTFRILNVSGHHVVPEFFDMHSRADGPLFDGHMEEQRLPNLVLQRISRSS